MNELIYDAGISRMDYAFELQETIEGFFMQGADAEHSEQEMLEKLDALNWSLLLHPIMENAAPLFEYAVSCQNGKALYKGLRISQENGYRLYSDFVPISEENGVILQRSMELWVMTDMTLLVTSCLRVTCQNMVTEYRAVKGCDALISDFAVDYDEVATVLTTLSNLAMMGGAPFYEL